MINYNDLVYMILYSPKYVKFYDWKKKIFEYSFCLAAKNCFGMQKNT